MLKDSEVISTIKEINNISETMTEGLGNEKIKANIQIFIDLLKDEHFKYIMQSNEVFNKYANVLKHNDTN